MQQCKRCKTERPAALMSRSVSFQGVCLRCVAMRPRGFTADSDPDRVTGEDLKAFRQRYNMSQAGASYALGCSTNSISAYENGRSKIPTYIGLAMSAFAAGLRPYKVGACNAQ